jgi:hypothetical protein
LLVVSLARVAGAQEQTTPAQSSKDQELEAIKKRLEVLEQEKAQRDAAEQATKTAKEEHGADPAEEKWYDRVTVGGGVRTDLRMVKDAAPNGRAESNDFELNSARIYLTGKVTDIVSVELNTEYTGPATGGSGPVTILDAIAKFHFKDEFNFWAGRMLPPSGRSNLDGPYYLTTWDFPFVEDYPAIFAGRDNGAAIWGDLMDKKFRYHVGVFEGNMGAAVNRVASPLYAARFTYQLWDPEPAPWYYTGSTYYGGKDILAIALAGQLQRNGAGVLGAPEEFRGGDLDILFEKKLGTAGVLTVEAALYLYYMGQAPAPAGNPIFDTGTAQMLLVAFLLPDKIGWGQLQPHIRFQHYDSHQSRGAEDRTRYDIGVNYVISGHNALISAVWSQTDRDSAAIVSNGDITREFVVGVQVQF